MKVNMRDFKKKGQPKDTPGVTQLPIPVVDQKANNSLSYKQRKVSNQPSDYGVKK